MTEEEATQWIEDRLSPSDETMSRLVRYVTMLLEESDRQNLIARSTRNQVWARHIVDSAQLLPLTKHARKGQWLDLGSGPGLPGLIIAILSDWPVVLVESRTRRVEFLQHAVQQLSLGDQVSVIGTRLERVESFDASVISARAFAPLNRLLPVACRFSRADTLWLLPKGRNAAKELDDARQDWKLVFHVEHSLTDSDAGILTGHVEGRRK